MIVDVVCVVVIVCDVVVVSVCDGVVVIVVMLL